MRKLIKDGDFNKIKEMVPECIYKYLINPEAKYFIEKIKQIEDIEF